MRIDRALFQGIRTLPRGSSLAQLLAEARGVRNPPDLPPLRGKGKNEGWARYLHGESRAPWGRTVMAKPLVSDALWERIEPLLPRAKPRRFRFPGRKPLEYRKILTGIIFVLKTGIN